MLVFSETGLTVRAASPKILLAMKGLAAREKDKADMATLIPLTNIRTLNELLALVRESYPDERYKPPSEDQLERIKEALGLIGLR